MRCEVSGVRIKPQLRTPNTEHLTFHTLHPFESGTIMRNLRRLLTGWSVAALTLGVAMARADEQLVTVKYVGTDVRKAISMLQTVSGLRVLVDPKVPAKRITLSLKDLPPEDALRTVASAAGLNCRKLGNAFLVEPRAAKKPLTESEAQVLDRAAADLQEAERLQKGAAGLGGIVQPHAPPPPDAVYRLRGAEPVAPVEVSPEVLEALERPVEVAVKNGPISEVTRQLSRSTGIKVSTDSPQAAGLVATVELRGIALKAALELVAGQTGLQISPRPDGVAFVTPGLSLDMAQARMRQVPAGAQHVDQGQLWTAEWANALSSGISTPSGPRPHRDLRRQPMHPEDSALELKPRRGAPLGQPAPAGAPRPAVKSGAPTAARSEGSAGAKAPAARGSKKTTPRSTAKTTKAKKGKKTARSEE